MKKIVVPVDFSGDSLKALQRAVYMAKKMQAEVALIHVNKTRSFLPFFKGSTTEDEGEIQNSFKELLSNLDNQGVNISTAIRNGKVSSEITKYAEEEEAYLIVMGTHGASGTEEMMMGSNAYRVVANADCPVLTMRGTSPKMDFERIVLPVDTTPSTRHKVPFTMEIAKAFNAEVHVVATSIDDTREFVMKLTSYTAQVARFLNEYNVRTVTDFLSGSNITDMTLEYARKVDADLISIMTEQETSVFNMFMGAYAQQMVNHSPIPVLSMHKNANIEGDVSIM